MSKMTVLMMLIAPMGAQSVTGLWCAASDAQDCLSLQQNGDAVQGNFLYRNSPVANVTGWVGNGAVVLAFRRTDNAQVATFNAVLDSAGRLAARTINPDGSVRWTGTYVRAAAATPACGLRLEPSTDRIASDYRTVGTANASACCAACEQDPKCRAFSWVDSQQTCYLKNAVPPPTPAAGITSGTKGGAASVTPGPERCTIRLEDNTDLYASDYKTLNGSNAEVCCIACGKDPNCRAFTWVPGQNTCYLKSAVPARSMRSGFISGVK